MLKVIRKDLILNRNALIMNGVIFMGFAAYLGWEPDTPVTVYVWLTTLMFTFLSATVMAREDKYRTTALSCSLPVTRRTIVRARYVMSIGLALAGVAVAFSLGSLLPFSQLPVDELLRARTLLLAVTVVVVALGVLLPFTVRFGMFGVFAFLIGAQVLGVLALVIARLSAPARRPCTRLGHIPRAVAACLRPSRVVMEPILELRQVSKAYEGFALRDVSFTLPRGYIMGLIGANGAGKTTLVKLILNLVQRDGGDIRVFGLDNRQDEVAVRSRIGFVHERPVFHDHLSVERAVACVAPFYAQWDDGTFRQLAAEFDLPLKKRVRTLSRGMRTRLALAVALAHRAELLLLVALALGLATSHGLSQRVFAHREL
jgi:ABC-type branched-subunit amino acid transport system ATPase component